MLAQESLVYGAPRSFRDSQFCDLSKAVENIKLTSNGRVVPRPSERLVPSTMQAPG